MSTAGFTVWLILAIAELPAVGLIAVASRRHGEGRHDDAVRAVYEAFWLGIGVAFAVGGVGLVGLPGLFAIMGTDAEVTAQGAAYLAVYLAGAPVVFSYFVMDSAFRAAGDTRTPLILLAVSLGLNMVLDPLLILGIGVFPRLGIQGAALATLVTRTVGCLLGFRWLVARRLAGRSRARAGQMWDMARIGLPVAAGGATFSVVYILLTRITSEFGTPALAALGVGHKVESLSYMTCVGFGMAAATAVGQNMGAGDRGRAELAGRLATRYAVMVTGAVGLAFLLVPGPLVGLFTHDPDVIRAGSSYLRIVSIAQLFMALEMVFQMGMEGAGYTAPGMIASVVLTVLRLPLALVLRGPLGVAGIWWSISATAIGRGAAVGWIWRLGRWKLREV